MSYFPSEYETDIPNISSDNRAMTSLNMSKNGLLSKEAGKVLGAMLKGNTILKELDVSSSGEGMLPSNKDGSGFAKELAVGIKDNGALSQLDVHDNRMPPAEEALLQGACGAKGISLLL
jgi:hypothetical protein